MAKQRQPNTLQAAIKAVTKAARAEANGTLTPGEKEVAINKAMDIVDNSNAITMAENVDDAIEAQIQAEADAEQDNQD